MKLIHTAYVVQDRIVGAKFRQGFIVLDAFDLKLESVSSLNARNKGSYSLPARKPCRELRLALNRASWLCLGRLGAGLAGGKGAHVVWPTAVRLRLCVM